MKRLYFYIAKRLLTYYVLCFLSVMMLYIVVDAFSNFDKLLAYKGSLIEAFLFHYGVLAPSIFYIIAPAISALAGILTLSSLSGANELDAVKAAGISLYRAAIPLLLFSLAVGLLQAGVQEFVIPALADKIRETKKGKIMWNLLLRDSNGSIWRMTRYYPATTAMGGIEVTDFYENGIKRSCIRAAEAVRRNDGWLLTDCAIYRYDRKGRLQPAESDTGDKKIVAEFTDRFPLPTDIIPADLESMDIKSNSLSFGRLNNQYRRQPHLKHLRVQLHSRIAFPLSCFVLLLLSMPFALKKGRRQLFFAALSCIMIITSYFAVMFFFLELGNGGALSPVVAAWLPSILFGCLGVSLLDTIAT